MVLLVATALYVGLTYAFRPLWVCHQEMAQSGTVSDICGPLGTDDVAFLGLIVFICLLIFPDLSEVSIAGLGSIKRAISQQAVATQNLERSVHVLEARFSQTQVVSQTHTVYVNLREAERTAGEKRERVERGEPAVAIDMPQETRAVSPARARQIVQLIDYSAQIGRYSALATQSPDDAMVPAGDEGMTTRSIDERRIALRSWAATFKNELLAFLAADKTLRANVDELSNEDLSAAIALGRHLLDGVATYLNQASWVNEETRLTHAFRRWLEGQGWTVTVRPMLEGGLRPDLTAERAEARLVAEIQLGKLSVDRLMAAVSQLDQFAGYLDASLKALVVPAGQGATVRHWLHDRPSGLRIRAYEVAEDGEVRELDAVRRDSTESQG